MKFYLDRTWAVMDGTILNYSGTDVSLKIPDRFADMSVSAIGDGAFMDSEKPQQVILPRCIKSIGEQAFSDCTNLVNVYIPGSVDKIGLEAFGGCDKIINFTCYDIELSEHKYIALKSSCRNAGEDIYVAHAFPKIETAKNALHTMEIDLFAIVPDGIQRLFVSQELSEDDGSDSLTRALDRIEFNQSGGRITEEESFIALIGSEEYPALDKETEEKNDAFARIEKYPDIEKTAVFTFDDSKTKTEGRKRYITANIKIGYHFWQSKVPIRYNGRDYYIYRRHYLSSTSDISYIRKDTAVFTKDGLVTNIREAQEVYAKYKLLSIL